MRKIALAVAVAVAATLPSLTAADQAKEAKIQRSPGGTKAPAAGKEFPKNSQNQGKFAPQTGSKKTQKETSSEKKPPGKSAPQTGSKETFKFNQSKPAQNPGAKEPGKLEKIK